MTAPDTIEKPNAGQPGSARWIIVLVILVVTGLLLRTAFRSDAPAPTTDDIDAIDARPLHPRARPPGKLERAVASKAEVIHVAD